MRTSPLLLGALGLTWLASPAAAQEPDAVALFLKNCASCHGETGDGQGTQELDRPARSFRDGGFSYGNTPDALFRTISMGIPGTPMPGFDTSLSEAERYALANYVTTLGPEVRDVSVAETVLVVADRPRIVRGMLPAISSGAVGTVRGLLIGTPDGLTFEYDTADVRLLGVRMGGFVERTDWSGRGGTELKPLGRVVHLMEGGRPQATFRLAQGEEEGPLVSRLASTWMRGREAGLTYRLQRPAERDPLVWVRESAAAFSGAVGSGFRRHFALTDAADDLRLAVELPRVGDDHVTASFFLADPEGQYPARSWTIVRRPGPVFECVGTLATGARMSGLRGAFTLDVGPARAAHVHVVTINLPSWSDEQRRALAEVPFP